MEDMSGSLGDPMTHIGRAAKAERWAAEIIGTRTPATGLVNTAFRATAQATVTAGHDPDGPYMSGMGTVLAVLVLAYTGDQDTRVIASIMSIVMDYWLTWVKDNPDA